MALKRKSCSSREPAVHRDMVRYYTREAGVRSLERELSRSAARWSKTLLRKLEPQVVVTADNLPEFLGVRKYTYGRAELQNQVGPGCRLGVDRGGRRSADH